MTALKVIVIILLIFILIGFLRVGALMQFGDELRVQSKSRDDLQEVQRMLKAADLDVDLQFVNYR